MTESGPEPEAVLTQDKGRLDCDQRPRSQAGGPLTARRRSRSPAAAPPRRGEAGRRA